MPGDLDAYPGTQEGDDILHKFHPFYRRIADFIPDFKAEIVIPALQHMKDDRAWRKAWPDHVIPVTIHDPEDGKSQMGSNVAAHCSGIVTDAHDTAGAIIQP